MPRRTESCVAVSSAYGVGNSADGRLVISDKRLFLRFVALERAVRDPSFEAVLACLAEIERHAAALGRQHVAFFATMYLSLLPSPRAATMRT